MSAMAQPRPWQPTAEQWAQFQALTPEQQAAAMQGDPNQATDQGPYAWGGYGNAQPNSQVQYQPTGTAMTGGQPQQGGALTFQQANDPTYIRQQLTQAMTQKAQALGQPPPTPEQIDANMHYITQPDTYGDGQVRSGWSPYWADRFGTPGAEGASGADRGGASTLVPGGVPQGGGTSFGQMAGFSSQPVNGVASFNAPGLLAPYTKEFQPTNINTILNADAFKAAQANGMDELSRSAAARGTLLTGGFGKDLMKYSMGLSLGELNNQFNRDATTYGTNRDTFYGNQNNAFNKMNAFTNTGAGIAQNLGGYGSGYAQNAQVNANNQGGLITGQGDYDASTGLANASNTSNTVGNAAKNATEIDWAKIFGRPRV